MFKLRSKVPSLDDTVGGGALVTTGIIVLTSHKLCHWAYAPFCWDFSGYSGFLGTVLVVIGAAYMLRGIRKRIKTGKWIDTN